MTRAKDLEDVIRDLVPLLESVTSLVASYERTLLAATGESHDADQALLALSDTTYRLRGLVD